MHSAHATNAHVVLTAIMSPHQAQASNQLVYNCTHNSQTWKQKI